VTDLLLFLVLTLLILILGRTQAHPLQLYAAFLFSSASECLHLFSLGWAVPFCSFFFLYINEILMQVVASQDWPEVTKYAGLVCAQAHRQELIQDLYKTWQDPVRGTVSGGMIKYDQSLTLMMVLCSKRSFLWLLGLIVSFHSAGNFSYLSGEPQGRSLRELYSTGINYTVLPSALLFIVAMSNDVFIFQRWCQ
jgi:hypothetical protein